MKLIKHTFFMITIAAVVLAIMTSWPTASVADAEAAISHLQEQTTFKPTLDTYVASGFQWADNARGDSAGLFVGYGDSEAFDLGQTRTFLKFDNITLPKNQVLAGPARLRLYFTFATFESPGEPMNIEVRKVTGPWDEQATWNSPPSYDSTSIANQDLNTQVARWVEWQIPQDVIQAWIDNPEENYGIALVSPDGEMKGRHIRNFHSKEHENGSFAPELIVRHDNPIPTPTPTNTPMPTPTPTPIPPSLSLEVDNQPSDEVTNNDSILYVITYRNATLTDTMLSNVVITGSIPNDTIFGDLFTPDAEVLKDTNEVILNVGNLSRGQEGKLIYSVTVSPTNKMVRSTIPMMNVITTPTDSTKQGMNTNSLTRKNFRSPFLSNSAIVPATEPKMESQSIPIVNCVTANSDQTDPATVCAYNGGTRLFLPMMMHK